MLQSEPLTVSKSVTLSGEIPNTISSCNKTEVVEFLDKKKSIIGGVGVEEKTNKEMNGEEEREKEREAEEGEAEEEEEEENADESFIEDDDDDDDDYSAGGENDESFYPDQDEEDEEEEEEEERDRRRKRSSNTKRSIISTDRLSTEISDVAEEEEGSENDLEGRINLNDMRGGEEEGEVVEVEEDEEEEDSSSDDGEEDEEEEEEDKKIKKKREIRQKHESPAEGISKVKVKVSEEKGDKNGVNCPEEIIKKELINLNNSSAMILDLTNSDVREDNTVSQSKTTFKIFNLNSMAMKGASSLFSSAPLKITKTVTSSDTVILANTESKKPFQTCTVKELQLLLKARKLTISGTLCC